MDPMVFLAFAFVSVVSMKEHPRNERGADLEACMDLAREMLHVYAQHVKEFSEFCQERRKAVKEVQ